MKLVEIQIEQFPSLLKRRDSFPLLMKEMGLKLMLT